MLDVARGLALAAMAAYHAAWDAGFLQLSAVNHALTPAGRITAHVVAGTFLALVGIGLVLANRNGIAWRGVLTRFIRIGGAAGLITVATLFAFHESYIFFGILHCIALSSLIALPFLRLPPLVTGLAALAAIAAPRLVAHPLFEAPPLVFLGFSARYPNTNDFVPLFPWFGLVLAGIALARIGLPILERSRIALWQPRAGLARLASLAGRHSLAVYLIHQPVLLALVFGLVSLTGPHPKAGLAEFRARYQLNCVLSGGGAEACRIASRCTADALRRDGLWGLRTDATAEQRAHARALSQGCYQAAEGTAPPP